MKISQKTIGDDEPRFTRRHGLWLLLLLGFGGIFVTRTYFLSAPSSSDKATPQEARNGRAAPRSKFVPLHHPRRPAKHHDSFRNASEGMRQLLDEFEKERVFLVNVTTSIYPEGGGQHVRQVAIEAPDDTEIEKFKSALENYHLSEADEARLESQLLKRYFDYQWEYRLVVQHTPITENGDRLANERTISVTDTTHILERMENFEEKEEAGELYLSVGGNMSSFSYEPGEPHPSDPALSYSTLFKADPTQ